MCGATASSGRSHTRESREYSITRDTREYLMLFLVLATHRVALGTTRYSTSSAGPLLAHTRVALGGVESTPYASSGFLVWQVLAMPLSIAALIAASLWHEDV